jgi:hypothetical protein
MNRLVLLGNGFDLAHGMKTRYKDFIIWYIKECLAIADRDRNYEDGLIKISIQIYNHYGYSFGEIKNTNDLVDFLYNNSHLENFLRNGKIKANYMLDLNNPFICHVKSKFFLKLIAVCTEANWVDIEHEFYKELKKLLQHPERNIEALNDLNESLSHLIAQLQNYLIKLLPGQVNPAYLDMLGTQIEAAEVIQEVQSQIELENTMILNFNYTSTAEIYLSQMSTKFPSQDFKINYIHGKLDDKENPLIFGFGDELDEEYKEMEKSQMSGFLKYIKSFWYFRTSNYRNLIRFLNSNDYQVYTFGHSCGLSDRTMLNRILEHENCKSIKIFYYEKNGQDNFTTITEEISRHFKNKPAMRDRIVSLDLSVRMPQFDDEAEY